VLSFCFLLLILHSPAWTDTYPKNPDIDVLHYTFWLTLSDSTDEIVGKTTVDLRFLRPGVSEFAINLIKATPENEGRGMTVSALTSDRGPVRFGHDRNRIRVLLPAPSEAGQRSRFTISYRGLPAACPSSREGGATIQRKGASSSNSSRSRPTVPSTVCRLRSVSTSEKSRNSAGSGSI
jgi:hypothetical protein